MGVLDIIVLVVIGIFAVLGAIKGFIKSIFGLLSVTVAVLIASLLGGEIAKLISSISSGTGATFGADLANTIHEFLTSQGGIFTSIPTGGYTEGMVIDTLSTIGIPAVIGSVIAPPVVGALQGIAGVSLADAVAPVLAELAISAIGFIVVFVIVWALLLVVCSLLKKLFNSFKILKAIDILLGFVFGVVKGAIIICIPLTILTSLNFIPGLSELIANTVIVKWLAENNFIAVLLSNSFDIEAIVNGVIAGLTA